MTLQIYTFLVALTNSFYFMSTKYLFQEFWEARFIVLFLCSALFWPKFLNCLEAKTCLFSIKYLDLRRQVDKLWLYLVKPVLTFLPYIFFFFFIIIFTIIFNHFYHNFHAVWVELYAIFKLSNNKWVWKSISEFHDIIIYLHSCDKSMNRKLIIACC